MAEDYKAPEKIRIQTLDSDFRTLQDRLVEKGPELAYGPKEKHQGPVRIEILLTNQDDVDSFKKYLDTLVGDLPLRTVSPGRGRPAASNGASSEPQSPREDLLQEIENKASAGDSADKIIQYLRGMGWVFLLTEDFLEYFKDFPFKTKDVGEPNSSGQYPGSLTWLVRCIKKGKDPRTDKFDPQLILGFDLLGDNEEEESTKIYPYLYKDRKKPIRVALEDKNTLQFSKVEELTKFPVYMTSEERLKFSIETRQLILNKEKVPSKFFLRWSGDVSFSTIQREGLAHLNIASKEA